MKTTLIIIFAMIVVTFYIDQYTKRLDDNMNPINLGSKRFKGNLDTINPIEKKLSTWDAYTLQEIADKKSKNLFKD